MGPLTSHKRVFFLTILVILGILRGVFYKPSFSFDHYLQPLHICGTVGFPTEKKLHGHVFVIERLLINQKKIWGRLQIRAKKIKIKVGDQLCLKSKIIPIKNFGMKNEFDLKRHFLKQNIWGKIKIKKKDRFQIKKNNVSYPIQSFRQNYALFLDQFKMKGILKALSLGIKSDLSSSQKQAFIKSGVYHLLVISGLHVGLLLLFMGHGLYLAFSQSELLLLKLNVQKLLILLSVIMVSVFYIFSGASISILRASVMGALVLLSLWHSKPHQSFFALSWALVIVLNLHPSSLKDPSFQLSFLAVGALCFLPYIYSGKNKIYLLMASVILINLVTLPVVVFHFHRFSLVSVFSNLIAIPYVSFVLLPLSLFVSGLYLFKIKWLAKGVLGFCEPLYQLFLWGAEFFASFKWSSIYMPLPNGIQIALYYFGLTFIFYLLLRQQRQKAAVISFFVVGVLIVSFQLRIFIRKSDVALKISFLSVGQGDSTLIELPRGKVALVDAGGLWGNFDVAERLIAPYLWQKSIYHIDILILTHADYDHIAGSIFLIKQFGISEIWLSQWQLKAKTFTQIIELAEKNNVAVKILTAQSNSKSIQQVQFNFLNPSSAFSFQSNNNQSLVFQLKYGNFSALFAADIEKAAEEALLSKDIKSTVLKVPHHGSKTSSHFNFLKKVSPKLAIISCGYLNRHGHPHEDVLKLYQGLGIEVQRTDELGAISMRVELASLSD